MIIYLLLFSFTLWGVFLFDLSRNTTYVSRQRKTYYLYLSIFITLLSALRYRLGVDGLEYEDEFYPTVPSLHELFSQDYVLAEEPLWLLLCSVLKEFTNSFVLYQIVYSIVINSVLLSFIYRKCNYPFISVLIYLTYNYFYLNCELLRQGFAISIFLCIEPYLEKRAYSKYFMGSIIALFFHYSAFFLFIVPLIRNITLTHKNMLFTIVVALFIAPIFAYMSSTDLYLLGIYFGDKFHVYASRSEQAVFNTYSIITIVIPCILLFLSSKHKRSVNKSDKYLLLYMFFLIISPYFSMAKRIGIYFEIYYMVETASYIGNRCLLISDKELRLVLFFPVLLLFTLNYYTWFGIKTFDGKHRQIVAVYPYSSIFSPEKDHARETSGWASLK